MGDFCDSAGIPDNEKFWIEFSITINFPYAIFLLAWLLWHVWKILYKQRKFKVLPLTTFYILAIANVVAHMYLAVMFAEVLLYGWVVPQLMCQTIMFALTIQQTWVVIELCMVINHIKH